MAEAKYKDAIEVILREYSKEFAHENLPYNVAVLVATTMLANPDMGFYTALRTVHDLLIRSIPTDQ